MWRIQMTSSLDSLEGDWDWEQILEKGKNSAVQQQLWERSEKT